MNAYSDLIYLMGAMIVFSLLSIQTSRLFQMNTQMQMEAEIEYNAISVAQNQIDKMKWIKTQSKLNAFANAFPKKMPLPVKDDTLYYNTDVRIQDMTIAGSTVQNKKVTVSVTNKYLQMGSNTVKLQFVKSFDT